MKSDAAIATFVDRLLVAEHEWWIDGYVVDEARRNLVAKVPARSQQLDVLVSRPKMSGVAPIGSNALLGKQFGYLSTSCSAFGNPGYRGQ